MSLEEAKRTLKGIYARLPESEHKHFDPFVFDTMSLYSCADEDSDRPFCQRIIQDRFILLAGLMAFQASDRIVSFTHPPAHLPGHRSLRTMRFIALGIPWLDHRANPTSQLASSLLLRSLHNARDPCIDVLDNELEKVL